MQIWELVVIALGLSMDAFAVSICKGLTMKKMSWKNALIAGLYFGGFQGGMPLIGYFLGVRLQGLIQNIDHWIAFVLLLLIGANMIKESLSKEEDKVNDSFGFKAMFVLAIATSIDALAVGVTFAFLNVNNIEASSIIAGITFIIAIIGTRLGHVFGCKFKSKAELAGGIILIIMGIKILMQHLGILGF